MELVMSSLDLLGLVASSPASMCDPGRPARRRTLIRITRRLNYYDTLQVDDRFIRNNYYYLVVSDK